MNTKILTPLVLLLVLVGIIGYAIQSRQSTPEPQATTATASSVSYQCEPGSTAYALLAAKYTVTTKDTSFGKQVIGIDGNKPTGNQYWAFYVDGQMAPVGAEAYTCVDSETVEWKVESF